MLMGGLYSLNGTMNPIAGDWPFQSYPRAVDVSHARVANQQASSHSNPAECTGVGLARKRHR